MTVSLGEKVGERHHRPDRAVGGDDGDECPGQQADSAEQAGGGNTAQRPRCAMGGCWLLLDRHPATTARFAQPAVPTRRRSGRLGPTGEYRSEHRNSGDDGSPRGKDLHGESDE